MPDKDGNTGGEGVESPLHAYERHGDEAEVEGHPEGVADKLAEDKAETEEDD